MEVKVRQNLNIKAGKIAKISKSRSVRIVLKKYDARKELIKAVSAVKSSPRMMR